MNRSARVASETIGASWQVLLAPKKKLEKEQTVPTAPIAQQKGKRKVGDSMSKDLTAELHSCCVCCVYCGGGIASGEDERHLEECREHKRLLEALIQEPDNTQTPTAMIEPAVESKVRKRGVNLSGPAKLRRVSTSPATSKSSLAVETTDDRDLGCLFSTQPWCHFESDSTPETHKREEGLLEWDPNEHERNETEKVTKQESIHIEDMVVSHHGGLLPR